jgi:hypothetical protein
MCDLTPSSHVVPEAHRALELLEDYHEKLTKPQDKQLRLAIERVIRIFKSRLFQALLGEYTCYMGLTRTVPRRGCSDSSVLCTSVSIYTIGQFRVHAIT